jgi:uncharacterized protein (TIGR01244 family)
MRSPSSAALAILAVLAATVAAEIPESVDPAQIPNYRVVRPGIATGGQPSPEALGRLKQMGFKTVINLRTEKEGARDEAETVTAAGLRYVWVPVSPDTFSAADVDAVAKAVDDPGAAPVLIHCSSANRVGGVWTVLQVRKGAPLERAEAEGRTIGLQSPAMWEAVRRVLGPEKP